MNVVPFFAYTDADGWRAGIGDPTIGGWLTVLGYALAAFLAWKVGRQRFSLDRPSEGRFWLLLAGILFVLGVNKQLDLQTWFTLTGKKLAQAQGWYEQRRIFQLFFILFITGAALWAFMAFRRLVGSNAGKLKLPLLGLSFLLTFVIIRAASFHHVDQFLHLSFLGFKMNWLFEWTGIAAIALGALANYRWMAVRRQAIRPRTA